MAIKHSAGFTLVEVLVALVLIGSVFALTASGWMTMSMGQKRVDRDLEELMANAGRQSIFMGIAGRILPWPHRDNAVLELVFTGEEDRLEFITARPGYEAGSAYQLWRWQINNEPSGYTLNVVAEPYYGGLIEGQAAGEVRDFFTFTEEPYFTYLQHDVDGPLWLNAWEDSTVLPKAIGLMREDGPPWIVWLRHGLPAICAGEGATENELCG